MDILKYSRIKWKKLNVIEGINWEQHALMDYAK